MEIITDKFELLLKKFNTLIDKQPPVKEVKDQLLSIKDEAKNSATLTTRQREAIVERCDNYANGVYGRNLSTAAH